jgi:hypothetical protein
MSKVASKLLGLVLFSTVTGAIDHYIVKEDPDHLQHNRPRVEQLVCGQCLAYNANTNLCLNYGANL